MSNNLRHISINRICRPKFALRPIRRNTPEYVEMVESMKKDGVLQPILVRPVHPSSGYDVEIVEGWHRFESAREAGLEEMPCLVRDMDDNEVLIFQLKCQAIRPETRTFEYAKRLKKLMEDGYTLPQLSALIDKSPTWIGRMLQMNRVCQEARPAIERGEIKMEAALALANLPADLQAKMVNDAVVMKTADFKERAEAANRDFKAFLLKEQQDDREIGAAKPLLRAINVLKRESLKPKAAKEVLKAVGAKTPRDGWVACLQWMFRLDPISVANRKAGYEERYHDKLATNDEFRQMTRDMIQKFVTPQSSTGDHRNGK